MENNARVIKNYTTDDLKITLEYLYNTNDWDIVECNVELDSNKLKQYHDDFVKQFDHLRFFFNSYTEKLDVVESSRLVKEEGKCGIDCGPISGFTLAWPSERYEPLPAPTQLNREMYPEVNYKTFIDDAKILTKFNFGYLTELIELLGVDALKQLVIVTHNAGMTIGQHVDRKDPLKLHIPIITNEDAYFLFGEEKERCYHMKVGKIYVLNTGNHHGTTNPSGTRTHMISRIGKSNIQHVLGL